MQVFTPIPYLLPALPKAIITGYNWAIFFMSVPHHVCQQDYKSKLVGGGGRFCKEALLMHVVSTYFDKV